MMSIIGMAIALYGCQRMDKGEPHESDYTKQQALTE
jgi:hypothetical protein